MKNVLLLPAIILVGAFASPARAQTAIDSYNLMFYAPGASSPMQTNTFTASQVTCNLAPSPVGASTVNPNIIEWTDPSVTERVCRIDRATVLMALPIGNYEVVLVAVSSIAGPSTDSNRAAFSRVAPPNPAAGVRVIKTTS